MHKKRTSRRVLMLAVMAWLVAAGPGPAFAKDDLPPTKDETGSGGACSPAQEAACSDTKNSAGKQCQNIKCTDGAGAHFQCDCKDQLGSSPGKKKGPG